MLLIHSAHATIRESLASRHISALNSWLPGDPRGWRSRHHKRHSSGDYKSPPPAGEHGGLHAYARSISGEMVVIPSHLRATVAETIRECLQQDKHRVLAIAVAGTHAHILAELPIDSAASRRIIGDAKNLASRRVRKELPGRVWSAGGSYKLVEDAAHQAQVFTYHQAAQR